MAENFTECTPITTVRDVPDMSQEELEMLVQLDETSPDENQSTSSLKQQQKQNVNELEGDQQKCKSLLIVNESDAKIIVYIYAGWSPFCMLSTISKIIEPKKNYLHQEETSFKFELVAMLEDKQKGKEEEKEMNHQEKCQKEEKDKDPKEKGEKKKENDKKKKKNDEKKKENDENKKENDEKKKENDEKKKENDEKMKEDDEKKKENSEKKEVKRKAEQKKKKLLGPLEVLEDKVIRITETLEYREENVADFSSEKRVCLRKIHREEELQTEVDISNLYDILGLDMKEVRKMEKEKGKEEAKTTIKKAYRKQMRIWHPDKNFGDCEIVNQIVFAKEILLDDARRARYHNAVDYDKGWFSLKEGFSKRLKAVFWPECYSEKQNNDFWKRIAMFAASVGLTIGGIVLSTAGAAVPALVICGAVFGSGFTGAGLLSLGHTMSKKSVLDGCDVKSWLQKGALGFVGGAATGGAGVGITAAVAGIGSAALPSSAVSFGEYIGIGMGTGAVAGVAGSLSSDAARILVDGENIPISQLMVRAGVGIVTGVTAGCLGGLVTKGIVGGQASATTSALEGDAAEQVLILTGGRRLANAIALKVSRKLTESGAEAVLGTASQFLEERLDDSVENQHPSKHVARAMKKVAINVAKSTACSLVSHGFNKLKVGKKAEDISEQPNNWRRNKASASYKPDEKTYPTNSCRNKEPGERKQFNSTQQKPLVVRESSNGELYEENQEACHQSDDEEEDESMNGVIKYKSKGYWFSKMIVTFLINGIKIKQEVSGDGARVFIPACATDIEVRFQVRRPFWGDIMKYDRFNKTWYKPYEPHIFRYERPVNRTLTISGNLGWEAVMRVSHEYHEETKEMS